MMCNCNNKGDNNEEYLIDDSNPLTHDPTIIDIINKIELKSIKSRNFSSKRETRIKTILLCNIVKRIQNNYRIFRTLKKNMSHANLVNIKT